MPPCASLALDLVAVREDLADQGHGAKTLAVIVDDSGSVLRRSASTWRYVAEQALPAPAAAIGAATRPPVALGADGAAVLDEHRDRVPGLSAGANAMNHACGCARARRLRGAGLARDRDARDLRRGARCLRSFTTSTIKSRMVVGGRRGHRPLPLLRVDPRHDVVRRGRGRSRRRAARRIMPPVATDSATSAICSGVTATSPWPIAACANSGLVLLERPSVGPSCGRPAGRGRSGRRGGSVDAEVLDARRELFAEVEADLTERRVARLDEALFERAAARSPPKFCSVAVVCGSGDRAERTGNDLVDVDVVASSAIAAVTILNVEPGG